MISTGCCARYVSASVRRFTCVNLVSCDPPCRASRGANGRLRGCLRPAEPFGSIPWSSASRLMWRLGLYQPELVATLREASKSLAATHLWKAQIQRDKGRSRSIGMRRLLPQKSHGLHSVTGHVFIGRSCRPSGPAPMPPQLLVGQLYRRDAEMRSPAKALRALS